jgi:hypothetical protein
MASENEIKQYLKLLIKEFETSVLADDRYRAGKLDSAFIHEQYNVAVDKFLKNSTDFEAKTVTDSQRLYYRGWIASILAMSLNLERQDLHDQEISRLFKEQGKLEKEIHRRETKIEKLQAKVERLAEKAKRKARD